MKKSLLMATILFLGLVISSPSSYGAPWIRGEGSINFDMTGKKSEDFESQLRIQDAEVRFELLLKEGIKIVVKGELENKLNKETMDNDFDLGKFLEEAYIQIETDKISGLPRAIITAGKHKMAFGQNYSELPLFKDSLLYDLSKQDEVIGLTVQLPVNFFKMVDSIAVSLFEAGAGDLKISNEKGFSIQLSKKLTDQLDLQVSAMMKDHAGSVSGKESRGSIGFVFKSKDGNWKVWAEGLLIHDNPEMVQENTYGATVGASYKVGPGAVVVEYSVLQKSAQEVAVAYNMPVGKFLVLSPEVRFRKDLSGEGTTDTTVGIRARIQYKMEGRGHELWTGKKN